MEDLSPEDILLIEHGFEVVRQAATRAFFKVPVTKRRLYKQGE